VDSIFATADGKALNLDTRLSIFKLIATRDTNQHSIVDAHPGNLDDIVFPGQDYNNARYDVPEFRHIMEDIC
jgi:hypothetical protein